MSSQPIRINFSDVPDLDKPVPAGEYRLQLLKASVEKGPKAPYINWEFDIISPVEHTGRHLWMMRSLSSKLFPRSQFRSTLVALGESREGLKGDFELNLSKYIGVEVLGVVSIEKYQGVERNKVDYIESLDSFDPNDNLGLSEDERDIPF